jgi:hypothetical protein
MHHQPPAVPASPTPFELVGGAAGIARLIDVLLDRLLYDPLLAPALIELDPAPLRRAQEQFFTDAFTGRPARGATAPLMVRVSDHAFVQVILHVRGSLFSMGFTDASVDRLMLAVIGHALEWDDRSKRAGDLYTLGRAPVGTSNVSEI